MMRKVTLEEFESTSNNINNIAMKERKQTLSNMQ